MTQLKTTKAIGYFEEGFFTLGYLIGKNIIATVLFFLVLLIAIGVAGNQESILYKPLISPIIEVSTLLIAIGLAFQGYHRKWKESLYKTVTVHFKYQENYVLSCYFSDLTTAADVRQWGQQIGQQMTGALLDLEPFFDMEAPEKLILPSSGQKILNHKITFILKSNENLRKGGDPIAFNKSEYKRWYIKHDKNHERHECITLAIIAPSSTITEPTIDSLT